MSCKVSSSVTWTPSSPAARRTSPRYTPRTPPWRIGRQAIAGFYNNVAGVEVKTELLSFRAGGSEAAFVFAITVGGSMRIEPIEVMTFNADGQITSMRAFWGPADITTL